MRMEVERPKPAEAPRAAIFDVLETELAANFEALSTEAPDGPAYFLAYDLIGREDLWLEARDGAVIKSHTDHDRALDVDVRVGDYQLDNSHGQGGNYAGNGLGAGLVVAKGDDPLSLAQSLWYATEFQYRMAVDALEAAESSEATRAGGDGPDHPDFSEETSVERYLPWVELDLPALAKRWEAPLASASARLADSPEVLDSTVALQVSVRNHAYLNSEGSRAQYGSAHLRIMLSVTGQAEDGMVLERFRSFDVHSPEQLPEPGALDLAADELRKELLALRDAPVAEPYTGPAVLEGPAAGVFFHEIFGHRLEGHRQKDDLEGQTFTRMVGKRVLPPFLDVFDDPRVAVLNGTPLFGHYQIDDEAVPAQSATLVDKGELEGFLLGRSPVLPFEHSNGHGRRETGHQVVARQGNLIINAQHTVPEGKLREHLIATAKRADKPYGLWFSDIQGGYTITDRSGPQAFKVLPLMVYRVWTDGRPDELVRGVDIVGTPLSAFETLTAAGDEPGIFNGMCGAESGWVPVSAVSPSVLLSKIEIERASNDRQRPPLLTPPTEAGVEGKAPERQVPADAKAIRRWSSVPGDASDASDASVEGGRP